MFSKNNFLWTQNIVLGTFDEQRRFTEMNPLLQALMNFYFLYLFS